MNFRLIRKMFPYTIFTQMYISKFRDPRDPYTGHDKPHNALGVVHGIHMAVISTSIDLTVHVEFWNNFKQLFIYLVTVSLING